MVGTVAKAVCDKGIILGNDSRLQEALRVSDEVLRRFGDRKEADAIISVAKTLCNKGAILEKLNRANDSFRELDARIVELLGRGLHRDILLEMFSPTSIGKLLQAQVAASASFLFRMVVRLPRRTFFTFHYKPDVTRAWVVRNSWVPKVAQGTREGAGFFDSSVFEASQRQSGDSLNDSYGRATTSR